MLRKFRAISFELNSQLTSTKCLTLIDSIKSHKESGDIQWKDFLLMKKNQNDENSRENSEQKKVQRMFQKKKF